MKIKKILTILFGLLFLTGCGLNLGGKAIETASAGNLQLPSYATQDSVEILDPSWGLKLDENDLLIPEEAANNPLRVNQYSQEPRKSDKWIWNEFYVVPIVEQDGALLFFKNQEGVPLMEKFHFESNPLGDYGEAGKGYLKNWGSENVDAFLKDPLSQRGIVELHSALKNMLDVSSLKGYLILVYGCTLAEGQTTYDSNRDCHGNKWVSKFYPIEAPELPPEPPVVTQPSSTEGGSTGEVEEAPSIDETQIPPPGSEGAIIPVN